ncbi:MAG TPA: LacI family DNA-binding transcriptional regulator [Chthoniobacteraceae bacterium]|nr:LacI family DNA-binding transcriptional regulator [Chthoniobacteraceae bacterium]
MMPPLLHPTPKLVASGEIPLFEQIADYYRREIMEGALPEGGRLPSCQMAAQIFGVTPDTVDRAYNLLVKEKLVRRRRAVGTLVCRKEDRATPSGRRAKTPRSASKDPIVLMVRAASFPELAEEDLFVDYLNGLIEGFNIREQPFEIARIKEEQSDLDAARFLVEERGVRGLINLRLAQAATDYLVEQKVPMVMLDDDLSERGITSVVSDHLNGYREAWEETNRHGHRAALFLGYQRSFDVRVRECTASRELSGVACALKWQLQVSNQPTSAEVWAALTQLLGERKGGNPWPTVVFTQTDTLAATALRALMENGVRIPGEVSVIGFNDSLIARHFNPTIATVANARHKMGLAAAALMVDLLADRSSPKGAVQIFPTHFIARESFGKATPTSP